MDLTDSYLRVVPEELLGRYEWREVREAAAVLQSTSPEEFDDLLEVLNDFALTKEDILTPGGNEGEVPKRLNSHFRALGWREGQYDATLSSELRLMPFAEAGESAPQVQTTEVFSSGYKIDNVKGTVALDVEWNAKDGNLDRDLAAYRALYDAAIITVGVMVTRVQNPLRDLARSLGREKGFATTTTTNLSKLEPRMTRGDSGGCPFLAVAISPATME